MDPYQILKVEKNASESDIKRAYRKLALKYHPDKGGSKEDETKFKEQQKNPAITKRIRQDYEEGIRVGVRGTPTIFINGKKLRDRSMKSMQAIIEKGLRELQEKSRKEAAQ